MRARFLIALAMLCAACAGPSDPVTALRPFYAQFEAPLPTAGAGAPLPSGNSILTRLAFGSCQTGEAPIPILQSVAASRPDLFVYMGDNVYGDEHGDMRLPELRHQYSLLSESPDFRHLRNAIPMLAVWDDHDYGANDAGAEFSAKEYSRRIFEAFWGNGARLRGRDGVYDAYTFGPEGRRVQVIMLDTRSSRTELSRLPARGPRGPYAQSNDPDQRMLSDQQWRWLATQLRQPAELRFIVSSIQVLADGHDFEAWRTLPQEQERLYSTVRESGALGVVFVSGDRHMAGLYAQDALLPYRAYELTTSSLNLSFSPNSDEHSSNQVGDMFTPVNFGTAAIDWDRRTVTLEVDDSAGQAVRQHVVAFSELGL